MFVDLTPYFEISSICVRDCVRRYHIPYPDRFCGVDLSLKLIRERCPRIDFLRRNHYMIMMRFLLFFKLVFLILAMMRWGTHGSDEAAYEEKRKIVSPITNPRVRLLVFEIREVHAHVEWDQEHGLMREVEGSALSSVSCDNIVVDVEVWFRPHDWLDLDPQDPEAPRLSFTQFILSHHHHWKHSSQTSAEVHFASSCPLRGRRRRR